MRANRDKALKEVERCIGAGKIDAALHQLRRLPDTQPNDFPVMNRMGDLLARAGRKADAIFCYERIAQTFARAGFIPKSIALYKKILRLDPDRKQSLVELGDLFLKQELPGEARPHLLRAAELMMARGEHAGARDLYERLAAADPGDPRHRARLAEVCATSGDHQRAVDELVAVGTSLLSAGDPDQAEQAYRRATEIRSDAVGPAVGLADCQRARGDLDGALATLGQLFERHPDNGELLRKLVLYRQEAGRLDEALAVLFGAPGVELVDDVFETALGLCREQDDEQAFWERFDPFCERLARDGRGEWLGDLLDRLAGIEPTGNVAALERWLELARAGDEPGLFRRVLARLVGCYEAHSMKEQAAAAREQLAALEPAAVPAAPTTPADEQPLSPPEDEVVPPSPPPADDDEALRQAETPAVPLGRADEEFVSGRITQAEILEKYGLVDQALDQLRELTGRFPGHVAAQERRVELLRARGVPVELRDALVDLALARRAAGDVDGARAAVRLARRNAPLEAAVRGRLERLSLFDSESPATGEPAEVADAGSEVVIDFDSGDVETETPVEAEPQAPVEASEAAEETVVSVPGLEEDDDLSALTAALESQLFDEESSEPAVPEQESQQSLEEVFAAFRQHVQEEVGSEDHKTHYDLGIAYKEMGLLDEAIAEFEQALRSEALGSEAATMLAVCKRQQGEPQAAVEWYRKALAVPGLDEVSRVTLSYDLAEVLLETGSAREALELYRTVLEADPSYRDVRNRVQQLEARLGR